VEGAREVQVAVMHPLGGRTNRQYQVILISQEKARRWKRRFRAASGLLRFLFFNLFSEAGIRQHLEISIYTSMNSEAGRQFASEFMLV